MTDGYLIPRYPDVPLAKPHYESIYLTATNPADGTAIWIRYTVRKAPGEQPTGSVWFTMFTADGVRAAKGTVADLRSTASTPLIVGDLGEVDAAGARGGLTEGLSVSWELSFDEMAEPMSHLRRPWMYRSPIPKTKSTSPYPAMSLSGTVTVDGTAIVLEGWRGMLGHNWGSEHALRWIWLRGALFAEDPAVWLDVVIGRIRVGPVTLPWFANGLASLDGVRHRVGGAVRMPSITERADGADIELAAPGLRLVAHLDASRERSVGWEYADPAGDIHQVRNCSAAGLRLEVARRGRPTVELTTDHGAIYELGTHEFDPLVVMQPFEDR